MVQVVPIPAFNDNQFRLPLENSDTHRRRRQPPGLDQLSHAASPAAAGHLVQRETAKARLRILAPSRTGPSSPVFEIKEFLLRIKQLRK